MLEQLRRRTARRSTPVAPHPELTPQQRQHIIERSNSTGSMPSMMMSNALNYSSQGFPMRRFLGGGSVAERVLAFERSPAAFGIGQQQAPSTTSTGEEKRIPITVEKRPVPVTAQAPAPTQSLVAAAAPTPSSLARSAASAATSAQQQSPGPSSVAGALPAKLSGLGSAPSSTDSWRGSSAGTSGGLSGNEAKVGLISRPSICSIRPSLRMSDSAN